MSEENAVNNEFYEEFLVCPNCKKALYRRAALKYLKIEGEYCGKCGANITIFLQKVAEETKQEKNCPT